MRYDSLAFISAERSYVFRIKREGETWSNHGKENGVNRMMNKQPRRRGWRGRIFNEHGSDSIGFHRILIPGSAVLIDTYRGRDIRLRIPAPPFPRGIEYGAEFERVPIRIDQIL